MRNRRIRRDIDPRYLFIIIILVITSIIVVLTITLNSDRNLSLPERVIKDTVNNGIKFLSYPLTNLRDRNAGGESVLDPTVERLKAENMTLRSELEALKELHELDNIPSNYTPVTSRVISRNVNIWYNQIIIDRGESHGVKPGQAVVSGRGLVGVVSRTSFTTSTVRLITNNELRQVLASSIITNDGVEQGIITGYNHRGHYLLFNKINDNYQVRTGDLVVTSSLNPSIPGGILIGEVSGMQRDEFDLTTIIRVRPSSNFDNLTFLSILIREGD